MTTEGTDGIGGQPINTDTHFAQPKIIGYRQLSEADAAMMNAIKVKAQEVGDLVAQMQLAAYGPAGYDARWIAIGSTDLQKGFMALTRSVAKPESF